MSGGGGGGHSGHRVTNWKCPGNTSTCFLLSCGFVFFPECNQVPFFSYYSGCKMVDNVFARRQILICVVSAITMGNLALACAPLTLSSWSLPRLLAELVGSGLIRRLFSC